MSRYAHNHPRAKAANSGSTEVNPQFNEKLAQMAQESGGVVGLPNRRVSTCDVYQLLPPQYELNPDGEKSFGDAVEECRGGIRHILGRYHNAASARLAW